MLGEVGKEPLQTETICKALPVTPSLGENMESQEITAVLQMSICQLGFHQAVYRARLNSCRRLGTVFIAYACTWRAVKRTLEKSVSQK